MTTNTSELWPGYDQTGQQELLDMLEGKVAAAEDENNPAVDKVMTADLAQAIRSYEWLKRENNGEHHRELYDRAGAIVESWRPR